MKKFIIITMLLFGGSVVGQTAYGIKGGLNYGGTGDISYARAGVQDITSNEGSNRAGFHLGGFARLGVLGFFVQPELLFTRLTTDYGPFYYTLNKIDAPVLVGVSIFGPINVKAGPSFQYVLRNQIRNSEIRISSVNNEITVGYQLGAGVNLGRFGFDIRYEGGFQENTAFSETASENFSIDSRPSQWIFSFAYSLN